MTRGAVTGFQGTITGSNNIETLYAAIEGHLMQYQSAGVSAWEQFDVITATAASRDVVFRSRGDRNLVSGAGDASLFVRMIKASATISWTVYQDWTTSGSGAGKAPGGGNISGSRWAALDAEQNIQYWGVVNEYEFGLVIIQGGTPRALWFGSPQRTHVPVAGNGVGFTTALSSVPTTATVASISQSGSTSTLTTDSSTFSPSDTGRTIRVTGATNAANNGNWVITYVSATVVTYTNANGVTEASSPSSIELDVTLSIDRDLTGGTPANGTLTPTQKCWVYPVAGTNAITGIYNNNPVLATVVGVTTGPNTLTLIGVGASYPSGSIVGLDPCPIGVIAPDTGNFASMFFANFNNGTTAGAGSQIYAINPLIGGYTEATLDPAVEGVYFGSQAVLSNSNTTSGGLRGTPQTLSFWGLGTQANADRMQVDYATTPSNSWWVFPAHPYATGAAVLALGPGALPP